MKSTFHLLLISLFSFVVFVNCSKSVSKDKNAQSLLLAGIASSCFTIDSCFDQYAKTLMKVLAFKFMTSQVTESMRDNLY